MSNEVKPVNQKRLESSYRQTHIYMQIMKDILIDRYLHIYLHTYTDKYGNINTQIT